MVRHGSYWSDIAKNIRLTFTLSQHQYRYGRISNKTFEKARLALDDQQGSQLKTNDDSTCDSRYAGIRDSGASWADRLVLHQYIKYVVNFSRIIRLSFLLLFSFQGQAVCGSRAWIIGISLFTY